MMMMITIAIVKRIFSQVSMHINSYVMSCYDYFDDNDVNWQERYGLLRLIMLLIMMTAVMMIMIMMMTMMMTMMMMMITKMKMIKKTSHNMP